MNNDNEKTLAFRVSTDTWEKLRAAAARFERSRGAQARVIIKEWLTAEEAKNGKGDA